MSSAAALATGLAVLHAGLSFVVPSGAATAPRMPTSASMADLEEGAGFGVAGTACVALVAAGAVVAGYLPDGTPMNRAGNAVNHPETIGPDPHVDGSPLPRAEFCNSVGYLPDGTAMNAAGGGFQEPGAPIPPSPSSPAPAMAPPVMAGGAAWLQPAVSNGQLASMGGDVRSNNGFLYAVQKDKLRMWIGSPLPRALFVNDVGYLPDGTPMNQAGNAINHPESRWQRGVS
eukprot:Skav207176  [mRNA]  locus=scaffold573:779722:786304:- [translate_table: standard]